MMTVIISVSGLSLQMYVFHVEPSHSDGLWCAVWLRVYSNSIEIKTPSTLIDGNWGSLSLPLGQRHMHTC